ncbi:AAA family ATPase [Streptomyces griseolus]|uniref:AAA family ATPase n=1 Tax=Streptomyces griseolus TaxID=1909 RepID=UPI0022448A74|nr:AAA family ATPase [Streptomyces griseolus]MCW8216005.1 AAA family ATPase [Streptomyces griseolus]
MIISPASCRYEEQTDWRTTLKLIEASIRNFRGVNDRLTVTFDNFTALAGMNNSGKSTLLEALEIFFSGKAPDKEDLCKSAEGSTIEISCTFADPPESLVLDAQAVTNLADENLLTMNGFLVIQKTYDCALATPKVTGVSAICNHPNTEGYRDLISLKNTELKKRAAELGIDLTGVNKSSNVEMRRAIWAGCPDLNICETEVALQTGREDGKRIWEALRKELPHFALFRADRSSTDQDSEAQDPIRAAINQAVARHREALDGIAEQIQSSIQPILDETVKGMSEINPEMASSLSPRPASPKWESVFKVSLTDDDAVPVNKWGSGSRRLLLMSFFRAQVASVSTEAQQQHTIYAIEEPETALHPNMQRKLLLNLLLLGELEDAQVVVTTHSPSLARMIPIQGLRRVVREEGGTYIEVPNALDIEHLAQDLGVLPDHGVRLFIGVEGPRDIEFLTGIHQALFKAGLTQIDLPALTRSGEVVFIPLGGENLGHWVSRWKDLAVPEFYLFDRDNTPDDPTFVNHQKQLNTLNSRPNVRAVHTQFREIENYFSPEAVEKVFPDLGFTPTSQQIGDFAKEISAALRSTTSHKPLNPGNVKARLCSNADQITEKNLVEIGALDEVVGWFQAMEELMSS